jgi:pyruvate kinase
VICDLKGRSIRTSHFKEPHKFRVTDQFELRTDGFELESTSTEIQINNYELPPIMREGDIVLVGPDVRAVII